MVDNFFKYGLRKQKITIILSLSFFTYCYFVKDLCGQDFASEESLIKKATELFQQRNYAEALPLFSQLASLYPQDPNYNYKYGACLLFIDKDKEKPLKFLRYAVSKASVEPLAYYYYAKALHLNYYFPEAIKYYRTFIDKADNKLIQEFLPHAEIDRCNHGIQLLSNIKEIDVVFKKDVKRDEFFRAYDVSDLGGKLIVVPEEFKTKLDKKKGDVSVIYLPKDTRDEVYFASYGQDGKNGKDIYKISRLPNGEWGKPLNLGPPINTPEDEDFAFMHPDGKTLYFASKGHNSMGGYDIFKSTYNPNTGQWSKPENLDFAFSSADDDIMFVTDMEEKLAFFASTRNAKHGEITVYRVSVLPKPAEYVILKGQFVAEQNPQQKSATITVIDANTGELWGKYNTQPDNGQYVIVLPGKGGQYKFILETTEDAPVHTGNVSIPRQTRVVALAQELRLVGKGENEKLVIKNLFDKELPFSFSEPLLVDALVKKKAMLEINATEAEILNRAVQQVAQQKADEEAAKQNVPPSEEIKKLLTGLNQSLSNQIAELQKKLSSAYNLANGKMQQAKEYKKKSDDLNRLAATAAPDERQMLLAQAKEYNKKSVEAGNIAMAAKKMADMLQSDLNEFFSTQTDIQILLNEAQLQLSKNNTVGAYEKYQMAQQRYNDIVNRADSYAQETAALEKRSEDLRNKREEELAKYQEMSATYNEISTQISDLEAKMTTARKKEKELLQQQIDALKTDREDIEFQLTQQQEKLEKTNEEYLSVTMQYESFRQTEQEVENMPPTSGKVTEKEMNALSIEISRMEKEGIAGNYKMTEEESSEVEVSKADKNDYLLTDASLDQLQSRVALLLQETNILLSQQNQISEEEKRETIAQLKNTSDSLYLLINKYLPDKRNQKFYSQLTEWIEKIKENNGKIESLAATEGKENVTISPSSVLPEEFSAEKIIRQTDAKLASDISKVQNDPSLDEREKEVAIRNHYLAQQNELKARELEIKMAWAEEESEVLKKQLGDQILLLQRKQEEIANKIAESESRMAQASKNIITPEQSPSAQSVSSPSSASSDLVKDVEQWVRSYPSQKKSQEDEAGRLKYFNAYPYTDKNAQKLLLEARKDKIQISDLSKQANALRVQAMDAKDEQQKISYLEQASALEQQSEELQIKVADKYAYVNRSEYEWQLNEAAKKDIVLQSSVSAEELALPSLLLDEARVFYEKAEEKRKVARTTSGFNEKAALLQEAYENELMAIAKLNKANTLYNDIINKHGLDKEKLLLAESTPSSNQPSTAENSKNMTSNDMLLSNVSEKTATVSEKNQTEAQKIVAAASSEKKIEESKAQIMAPAYSDKQQEQEPLKSPATSTTEKPEEKTDNLISSSKQEYVGRSFKEAISLYEWEEESINQEIDLLEKQVQATKKKKEKELLQQRIDSLQHKKEQIIQRKVRMAEILDEWNTIQNERINNEVLSDIEYRKDRPSEQVVQELNRTMSSEEIASLSREDDFITYHNNKNEKRRLLKEALIEYEYASNLATEAEQLQEQANEFRKQATATVDNESKKELQNKAYILEQDAEQKRKASMEKIQKAQGLQQQALAKDEQNALIISQINAEKQKKYALLDKALVHNPDYLATISTSDKMATTSSTSLGEKTVVNTNATENNNIRPEILPSPSSSEKNTSGSSSGAGFKIFRNKTEITVFLDEFVVPGELTSNIFATLPSQTSAYDNNRNIPENSRMPKGLVFTVQVGAFRNPIPQDLFKGFAPIWKEPSPSGINRYLAGLFMRYDDAVAIRDQIRKLGYSDAFVVAYLDGKRISYAQAMAMIGRSAESGDQAMAASKPNEVTPGQTTQMLSETSTPTNNDKGMYSGETYSYDIQTTRGVFFTIQIGVFSRPTDLKSLYNIDELIYSEKTDNNLYRYSVGKFNTPSDAVPLKNKMKTLGITDAFVAAYKDGKKIPMAQALSLIGEGMSALPPSIPQPSKPVTQYLVIIGEYAKEVPNEDAEKFLSLNNQLVIEKSKEGITRYIYAKVSDISEARNKKDEARSKGFLYVKLIEKTGDVEKVIEETVVNNTNIPEETSRPDLKSAENTENVASQSEGSDVIYKVVIGEFEEEVPNEVAEIYLELDDIESYSKGDTTVYTVGKFSTFDQALRMQEDMIRRGLKNARIAKYNRYGEEIK